MRLRGIVIFGLTAMTLAACGDDGGSDAGADTGIDGTTLPRTSPANIPWLAEGRPPVAAPVMTPCPPGWAEVTLDDVVRCTPYPGGGPEECATADYAHFPGTPGCERVGTECAADGWPSDLPADAPVVYVRAATVSGGDGTRDAPFRMLTEVDLPSLAAGTVVALGPGTYIAGVVVPAGVTLMGTCVAETTLTYTTGTARSVLRVFAADAAVRNLRIDGGSRRGITVAGDSASLTLSSVVVEGAVVTALATSDGATVVARDIAIRDTQTSAGRYGRAISAESRSSVLVQRGEIVGSHETAVLALGRRDGTESPDIRLEDVLVRDTRLDDNGLARALGSEFGGHLTAVRSYFLRNPETGVRASGETSTLTLEDVVIAESGGTGFYAREGVFELTRTWIKDSVGCGIEFQVEGTVARVTDLIVSDTADPGEREGAIAGACIWEADLTLTRALFARSAGHGVWLQSEFTTARATDLRVIGTARIPWSPTADGRGIMVQDGATLELVRGVVEDSASGGIVLGLGFAQVELTDVAVLRVEPTAEGDLGYGIAAVGQCAIGGRRVLVEESTAVGIYASNVEAVVTFEDAVIRDLHPAATAMGIGSYRQGTIDLTRFSILRAGLCGLQVAEDGRIDLSEGEVRGNTIGACVQTDPYDLGRLTDRVIYENETNLESTSLPVPVAPDAIPETSE